MNLRLIIGFLFIFSSSILFAQKSWTYEVKFQLVSEENDTVSIEEFKNGEIKLLTYPFRAHSNNYLKYDSKTKTFIFSQHTIAANSILVFQTQQNTTILKIQSDNLDLGVVQLRGNHYSLFIWKNKEDYIKTEDVIYWKLKYPLEAYIEEDERFNFKGFKSLVEVKVK
ncbi:hypothetical protein [Aureivirga sp. CE67]|uniref:hypothetical protein n=1 Tax=Aureivirga sp. CE67 TaxID=1788983 RepID=UPI0018C93499|nr:hypothetical protein [Aureivirga sp. CE67]